MDSGGEEKHDIEERKEDTPLKGNRKIVWRDFYTLKRDGWRANEWRGQLVVGHYKGEENWVKVRAKTKEAALCEFPRG